MDAVAIDGKSHTPTHNIKAADLLWSTESRQETQMFAKKTFLRAEQNLNEQNLERGKLTESWETHPRDNYTPFESKWNPSTSNHSKSASAVDTDITQVTFHFWFTLETIFTNLK